jgi:hypothetical protein
MEEYPPVGDKEGDRPEVTVRAIRAEIGRLDRNDRKELKKWMKRGGMGQVVNATEDEWVQSTAE